MQKYNLVQRKLVLTLEVEASIDLVNKGLAELQTISMANDKFHSFLLLLSNGFERLIKCLLCLAHMDPEGNIFSTPYETKKSKGHDISLLLNKLLDCLESNVTPSSPPAIRQDYEMLKNDKRLRKIVEGFSRFAQGGRYYNLDVFIRACSSYNDPRHEWQALETEVAGPHDYNNDPAYDVIKNRVIPEIVINLERFARALARMFTLWNSNDFAKQISPFVYPFLMLQDKDLGKREYPVKT